MLQKATLASPLPFLEWRHNEEGIRERIEELVQCDEPSIALCECAYNLGYLEESNAAAIALVEDGQPVERLVGSTLKLYAYVAMGDASAAYAAHLESAAICRDAFTMYRDDGFLFGTSVVCARFVEDCALRTLPGMPKRLGRLEDAPAGLQAYCGFQMALRAFMRGEDAQVIGMAKSFIAITGGQYPVSCIKLRLIASAAHLRLRQPEKAVEEFRKAWNLAQRLGIIMPFVELSSFLPGIIRHCLGESDETSYMVLRTMIARYRNGWLGLRERIGARVPGSDLSLLEYSVATLAVYGWTNREVSWFLGIAENTVKHYLSNAYRKLEVKNRGELVAKFRPKR